MLSQNSPSTPEIPSVPRTRQGCSATIGLALITIWILVSTVQAQSITWELEQVQFEVTVPGFTRTRFAIAVLFGLVLFVPLLLVSRNKESRQRPIYQSWMWAGLFALLVAPARLTSLSATQLAALMQIGGVLVYGLIFYLLVIRSSPPGKVFFNGPGWILSLALGALVGLPWLLWGALGSPWDLALNLVAALGMGVVAAWTIVYFFARPGEESPWMSGFVAAIALLIMTTGFGTNGLQWILSIILFPLGWVAVALAGREDVSNAWLPVALAIGLVAASPMTLLDPMELSQVINGDPGELMTWTSRGVLASTVIAIVIALILVLVHTRLRFWKTGSVAKASLAALWVAALAAYFIWGQPGFFGERMFVILKSQADVSAANNIQDYNQRRAFVYRTLVQNADTTQADLRRALDRMGIRYTPYYLVNGLDVQGGPILREWLARRPEVDRILNNPELRPLAAPIPVSVGDASAPTTPQWNLTAIEANRVWSELGVTGKGIVVGQSDSGVQGTHPELAKNYRGYQGSNDYNWYDPWYHTPSPVDINGHGTHTLATAVGKTTGVAPDAQWIGCVNLARNLGNPSFYLDCMQFMLAPFPEKGDPFKDGDPSRGAEVINNSWGCPQIEGCDPNALLPAVNALSDAGIFVVASAGNDGELGCGTVRDPLALYADAYSVGAVDRQGQLATFSSLGPVTADGSDRTKPDIVAPGVNVLSAYPDNTYMVLNGTSMAGPHVVGVVALMWSANPALVGNIQLTRQILDQSAQSYHGTYPGCVSGHNAPNDAVGYGMVDAYQAVQAALAAK